jgi:single-stranded-DNA-specific exonuclease
MTETTQVGLRALIEASGMTGKNITAGHIGFILGPKLNAAGRISDPSLGVKLLTSEDPIEASEIAKRLVQTNEERQAIERDIVELAMAQVESKRLDAGPESPLPGFIVVSGKGWHGGVIGIVASRIVERYHRPTVVFGIQDGIAKGSGRSIEGFNLFEALSSVKDLFSKFGGHEQAAGMTLPADKLDDLEARLVTYANSILTEEDFKPIIKIDAVLSRETIHYNLTDALKMLEPHGPGNPKPLFRVNDLCVEKSMRMGRQQEYLKIIASDGPRAFELINFQNPAMLEPLKSKMKFDAVVQIDENEFRGIRSIQFLTKAIRVHDPALYMSETEIEAFNQTKVDALIKKSSADGSDQSQPCSDSTLQNSSQPAGSLTPQRYEAFSLQGYLRYHHRYRDQLSASEGSDAEFCLCPVESIPGTISVDPPEYDMKSETTLSLPDRDELKALYLKIKKNEPLQRPLSLTTLFGLRILEAAALIKAEGDRYRLLEMSGKIDLMASPLLKQLQMWAKA